ncbi:MAG: NUDIX domain-containing protein [Silvanigrellaceae bacterium]
MDSSDRNTAEQSVIPNFKSDCPLCRLAAHGPGQADFLCELRNVVVTRGPFAHRWPGAIQVTAKRHLRDPSQLKYPHFIHTQAELYLLEKAVREATRARHMNVVKFGNVVEHLHWHVIPRYANEIHLQKSPWELFSVPDEQLFHRKFDRPQDELYSDILSGLDAARKSLQPPFFSTSFFVRPKETAARQAFLEKPLAVQHQLIRGRAEDFECFLMQRNYLDFAWDTFGGEADPGETPREALIRELREELGWTPSELFEVTRQWSNGMLRGFCYLVTPSQGQLLQEQPERIPCDEVKQAGWVPLNDLATNPNSPYPLPLCGRARALVAGEPDFYI